MQLRNPQMPVLFNGQWCMRQTIAHYNCSMMVINPHLVQFLSGLCHITAELAELLKARRLTQDPATGQHDDRLPLITGKAEFCRLLHHMHTTVYLAQQLQLARPKATMTHKENKGMR